MSGAHLKQARDHTEQLLSDQGRPMLSFDKSEVELGDLRANITTQRLYNVDSVIMRLMSLAAFPQTVFELSFISPFERAIHNNLHVLVDGYQPHKTRNLLLGFFNTTRSNTVHILFPHGPPIGHSSTTALADQFQQMLVDDCFLPALNTSCASQTM